ncbi:MAG: GTPase [Ruminococcus sp.]|nr:GTPase [Ruminococcus sp.]
MNETEYKPVYLIQGFLESGKTSFIQKLLENGAFAQGERMLVILCEEGEEELDESRFAGNGSVTVRLIESRDELSKPNLLRLADECSAQRIAIEYNGMWHLADLVSAMPDDWAVFQAVTIIDAGSFRLYQTNLKSLVTDKLSVSDVVMINRFEGNIPQDELHTAIRSVTRRAGIFYMFDDEHVEQDDKEDPLPYDLSQDSFEVRDKDYAVFYNDILADCEKYDGKTVTFKGMISHTDSLPDDLYVIGRFIMTCCEADMKFCCLAARYTGTLTAEGEHWVRVSAEIVIMKKETTQYFPTLSVTAIEDTEPPEERIAVFM